MANKIKSIGSDLQKDDTIYRSYMEWIEKKFPELSKQDKFKQLRKDSEKLAMVLADDTFNQVKLGKRQ